MNDKDFDKHLGYNAKLLREESGLSQNDIANYLDISRSTYKQYENSKRRFPAYLILILSRLYGIKEVLDFFEENILNKNPGLEEKLQELKDRIQYREKDKKFKSIDYGEKSLQELADEVNSTIKEKIKFYRLKNNKSQQQVADKLNINLSTYSRYESGEVKIDNNKLGLLSEWYQISINEFFKK